MPTVDVGRFGPWPPSGRPVRLPAIWQADASFQRLGRFLDGLERAGRTLAVFEESHRRAGRVLAALGGRWPR